MGLAFKKEGVLSISEYLADFVHMEEQPLFASINATRTVVDEVVISGVSISRYTNEYWTSKQRQANPLHEISYRACFKPQLPRFFINLMTKEGDRVYDPFSGRGTTVIEAGLLGRNVIANDINPLSIIFAKPRFFVPFIDEVSKRLGNIHIKYGAKADIDLSMFFHPETEAEIVSMRDYFLERKLSGSEDDVDRWIKMVATNRLTGHSTNFFSVYTLPPNQAMSQEKQRKVNEKRNQAPSYKDTKQIILKKTKDIISGIDDRIREKLRKIGENAVFLNKLADETNEIKDCSVRLTVTSPPFLDVVQYVDDNWLRCWFNNIDTEEISSKITMAKKLVDWCEIMGRVFNELYRITENGGYVAFEVGEIRGGKINLDEYVVPLGLKAGFFCEGILINMQQFTKTANIWGIRNNEKGTNTNRIVIFRKG